MATRPLQLGGQAYHSADESRKSRLAEYLGTRGTLLSRRRAHQTPRNGPPPCPASSPATWTHRASGWVFIPTRYMPQHTTRNPPAWHNVLKLIVAAGHVTGQKGSFPTCPCTARAQVILVAFLKSRQPPHSVTLDKVVCKCSHAACQWTTPQLHTAEYFCSQQNQHLPPRPGAHQQPAADDRRRRRRLEALCQLRGQALAAAGFASIGSEGDQVPAAVHGCHATDLALQA